MFPSGDGLVFSRLAPLVGSHALGLLKPPSRKLPPFGLTSGLGLRRMAKIREVSHKPLPAYKRLLVVLQIRLVTDSATCPKKQRGGCHCDERHQQRRLDQSVPALPELHRLFPFSSDHCV